MSNKYIYAGVRSYTMMQNLLSESNLERLLGAKSTTEGFKVLQDTYIAEYLSRHEDKNLARALEESVSRAKDVLDSISPEPEPLRILWAKYDFYNLRTIIKGSRQNLSDEKILLQCFKTGIYPPASVLREFKQEKLGRLNVLLAKAAEEANSVQNSFEIDLVTERHYFEFIKEIMERSKDSFIKDYVTLLIDFFNIKTAIRLETLSSILNKDVFVSGGRITKSRLQKEEQIFSALKTYGGEAVWSLALEIYRKEKNFALLDKAMEEYALKFLKERSFDLFSIAPLFAYFSAQKNHAQTIRAVMSAKEAGVSEHDIRVILRRLYT